MKRLFIVFLITAPCLLISGQQHSFSRLDSLRGSITPEREWWDLTYYHLEVEVNPSDSSLQGSNTIFFTPLKGGHTLQVDLQPPLRMYRAVFRGQELEIRQEGPVHLIRIPDKLEVGKNYQLKVFYGGKPQIARRPPWDGGISWKTDQNGNPFVATACQGIGPSIWWPCKDHPYDEVDSMLMSITVPENLMDVSNGRLREVSTHKKEKTKTWHWFVANPINAYGVNLNIGDYVSFSEVYHGEKGDLDCQYYVLRDHLKAAKEHFKEVPRMLEAFEHWFGPYPFYEDSYKLVEAPYLGMEHQSSVTYGNGYQNGYRGSDLSGTGWGLKFDFIIVHESGHEWFANNITYADVADMWIHESFINYSESLFLDYHYGTEAGNAYVKGTRYNISNDRPIIGQYGVDHQGSGDMYYKGGNMLHTIRQIIGDDEAFRQILRGLNQTFYHQTVRTEQIENYMNERTDFDLSGIFDQYLRDYRMPVLEYVVRDGRLHYRFANCVRNFTMPLEVTINGKKETLVPTSRWKQMKLEDELTDFSVNPEYYVGKLNLMK